MFAYNKNKALSRACTYRNNVGSLAAWFRLPKFSTPPPLCDRLEWDFLFHSFTVSCTCMWQWCCWSVMIVMWLL